MKFFFYYGRRIVYSIALVWAFFLYYQAAIQIPTTTHALATLMRQYAFTALFLLYVVLVPGLLLSFFPKFGLNGLFVYLRRALGVSVFFFALLHGSIGFFNNLSGSFLSVLFLSPRNQWALVFSGTAFCIFTAMALTSFDRMEKLLGKRWKKLHKLIYVAGILVIFHAFFIGSHFTVPTSPIPMIVNILSLIFIFLEVAATFKRRWKNNPGLTKKNMFLFSFLAGVLVFACVSSYVGFTTRYDPHARHKRGYSTDYSMNVTTEPKTIVAGQETKLTFQIIDTRTGRPLSKYQILQDKLMHVVVLRKDLLSYAHIHPDYDGKDTFTVTHTFPADGTYSLFVEYSAPDFYENLSMGRVTVGSTIEEKAADLEMGSLVNTFAKRYTVTLQAPERIQAGDTVDFSYTLKDSQTGEPISDLETYLAAFGHMSAVSEDLNTYTHVHPITVPLSPTDLGGPTVQFSTFFPKAGKYKLFTQFKHKGEVFVTDFVVEVR
jgi:DMSO/TMAO reductase YedYZ heme-binding membrane subunit